MYDNEVYFYTKTQSLFYFEIRPKKRLVGIYSGKLKNEKNLETTVAGGYDLAVMFTYATNIYLA